MGLRLKADASVTVHTNPVPSDGNCTGTLGHLDPFNLTDAVVCNATAPEYCQEGVRYPRF